MKIEYTEKAAEQFEDLPTDVQTRIAHKLSFYLQQEDPLQFAKRLVGMDVYRFRIGEYRVLFELGKNVLYVLLIVKRDKAYRDL